MMQVPENRFARALRLNQQQIGSSCSLASHVSRVTVAQTLKWLGTIGADARLRPMISITWRQPGGLSRGSCFGVATTDAAKLNDLG
jgi:hypothetical protein